MANWQWFGKLHLKVFRATGGRVGASLAGIKMVMVDTIGRKSGLVRTIPIACYPYEEDITVVASNNGSDKDPIWWLNLQANPNVELQVGRKRYQAIAEQLSDEERDKHWPQIVKLQCGAGISPKTQQQKAACNQIQINRATLVKGGAMSDNKNREGGLPVWCGQVHSRFVAANLNTQLSLY